MQHREGQERDACNEQRRVAGEWDPQHSEVDSPRPERKAQMFFDLQAKIAPDGWSLVGRVPGP